MAIINCNSLFLKRDNTEVLKNFSLEINEKSITAIVGANGSGKSTLISVLAGDLKPDSGTVKVLDRDLSQYTLRELADARSVVLQHQNFWLAFTVREVIEMGQDRISLARVDEVMRDLELTEIADQSVLTLSGGQAQRVSIARALVRDTPIYLFDEPFASQDRASRARLISNFCTLRDQGKTIVIIAHLADGDLEWCDQVIEKLA
jgi:ABC-type cobalamin/Fe3+-siderophores transport system ATPase subunit